jgi:hypothetical protein
MKKGLCIVLFFLLYYPFVFAQNGYTLRGKVTDSVSGKPVAGCSVFINNTSRGTIANSNGEFVLLNLPEGKFELIISSIGYETYLYDFIGGPLPSPLNVTLKQKTTELSVVTVEPFIKQKQAWPSWGKTFLDNFIGKTPNARECVIKNLKALKFKFSKKYNRLTVIADAPLIIENRALGYTIRYQLEEFYCDYETHITLYVGYPLFSEMTGSQKKLLYWREQRKKVYYGSITHFMKSLYKGDLQQQGFQVTRNVKLPNTEKIRIEELYKTLVPAADTFEMQQDGTIRKMNKKIAFAADSIPYYETILSRPDFYNRLSQITSDSIVSLKTDGSKSIFFDGTLHIIYTHPKQKSILKSEVYLITPAAIDLEKNGGYYPSQELVLSGYWGIYEKIANTLPLDYLPGNY